MIPAKAASAHKYHKAMQRMVRWYLDIPVLFRCCRTIAPQRTGAANIKNRSPRLDIPDATQNSPVSISISKPP